MSKPEDRKKSYRKYVDTAYLRFSLLNLGLLYIWFSGLSSNNLMYVLSDRPVVIAVFIALSTLAGLLGHDFNNTENRWEFVLGATAATPDSSNNPLHQILDFRKKQLSTVFKASANAGENRGSWLGERYARLGEQMLSLLEWNKNSAKDPMVDAFVYEVERIALGSLGTDRLDGVQSLEQWWNEAIAPLVLMHGTNLYKSGGEAAVREFVEGELLIKLREFVSDNFMTADQIVEAVAVAAEQGLAVQLIQEEIKARSRLNRKDINPGFNHPVLSEQLLFIADSMPLLVFGAIAIHVPFIRPWMVGLVALELGRLFLKTTVGRETFVGIHDDQITAMVNWDLFPTGVDKEGNIIDSDPDVKSFRAYLNRWYWILGRITVMGGVFLYVVNASLISLFVPAHLQQVFASANVVSSIISAHAASAAFHTISHKVKAMLWRGRLGASSAVAGDRHQVWHRLMELGNWNAKFKPFLSFARSRIKEVKPKSVALVGDALQFVSPVTKNEMLAAVSADNKPRILEYKTLDQMPPDQKTDVVLLFFDSNAQPVEQLQRNVVDAYQRLNAGGEVILIESEDPLHQLLDSETSAVVSAHAENFVHHLWTEALNVVIHIPFLPVLSKRTSRLWNQAKRSYDTKYGHMAVKAAASPYGKLPLMTELKSIPLADQKIFDWGESHIHAYAFKKPAAGESAASPSLTAVVTALVIFGVLAADSYWSGSAGSTLYAAAAAGVFAWPSLHTLSDVTRQADHTMGELPPNGLAQQVERIIGRQQTNVLDGFNSERYQAFFAQRFVYQLRVAENGKNAGVSANVLRTELYNAAHLAGRLGLSRSEMKSAVLPLWTNWELGLGRSLLTAQWVTGVFVQALTNAWVRVKQELRGFKGVFDTSATIGFHLDVLLDDNTRNGDMGKRMLAFLKVRAENKKDDGLDVLVVRYEPSSDPTEDQKRRAAAETELTWVLRMHGFSAYLETCVISVQPQGMIDPFVVLKQTGIDAVRFHFYSPTPRDIDLHRAIGFLLFSLSVDGVITPVSEQVETARVVSLNA